MLNNQPIDERNNPHRQENDNVIPLRGFEPSEADLASPQLDQALKRVVGDVPVPDDLATRILIRAMATPPKPTLWQWVKHRVVKVVSVLSAAALVGLLMSY